MAKVYDPILCMMVEKPEVKKVNDAEVESPRSNKKYKIYGDVVTLKSITPATVTYETSNGYTQKIGRRKWNELAVKVTDAAATIDKTVNVVDASPINEFKDTKALCQKIISKYSGTVLGRKVDGNAIINYAESIIKKMDFYIENANKGWYD